MKTDFVPLSLKNVYFIVIQFNGYSVVSFLVIEINIERSRRTLVFILAFQQMLKVLNTVWIVWGFPLYIISLEKSEEGHIFMKHSCWQCSNTHWPKNQICYDECVVKTTLKYEPITYYQECFL